MVKKIHVSLLRVGMYVCDMDKSWMDTPFLSHSFLIKSRSQLENLAKYCEFVHIDTARGGDVDDHPARKPGNPRHRDASLENAYERGQTVLNAVFDDARFGRSVDCTAVKKTVQELTLGILKNADAMLYLTRLKNKHDDLARKSVNVCILTLVFAKHVGIAKHELDTLGLGALLHDIGMVKVPDRILNKPGDLTPGERKLVKEHVMAGADILAAEMPREVLDIVRSHHERVDGSGYPLGLKAAQIGLFARMVAITSTYEALTRERAYGRSMTPMSASQELYARRRTHFDERLVEKFIHILGVYPPGCLVEINTGEIGRVVVANPGNQLRPVLEMLADAGGAEAAETWTLDLAGPEAKGFYIKRVLMQSDPRLSSLTEL
jgi:putative nucleotidyltransferase with HDIG domain